MSRADSPRVLPYLPPIAAMPSFPALSALVLNPAELYIVALGRLTGSNLTVNV